MTKQEFITELQKKLSGLPKQEIDERITFYSEMIDDRVEEGLTEEEAILEIGSVDEISVQIAGEIVLSKIAKEKVKSKRCLGAWEIVLLVLGSPIWISLIISALAVILSIYIVLWSAIISIWAVFVSVAACTVVAIVGVIFIVVGHSIPGVAMIGASIICAGLSIFLFFGCKAATKGFIQLTKKSIRFIKRCFVKKEEVL